MIFGGFQKLTLLDYPGKVACTVFTKGCNFLCPFCHNSFLVNEIERADEISSEEILSYLKKRVGILEGVCITGGEPLLHKELEDFLREVKKIGYFVKLDTNGSFPERLKDLVNKGLIDYVAMDIKNSFEKYEKTAGWKKGDLSKISESIDFLINGDIDYEFRTTVVEEFHTEEDIEKIAEKLKGAKKYFLQNFTDSGNVIEENLHPVSKEKLQKMKEKARQTLENTMIRGEFGK
ncbi:MAG: anaerobic ribonucleoside-triphosphate reductase activating protein [Clostridia bacterium]|nr:anaerobic ribonucleoside-triphosphate reductase activating protein [Clostridia bacterium]